MREGSAGYASDLAIRLDLINLEITETSSEPEIVTPAIHLSTNLRVYDSQGEQDWLHGGPLQANRLRSIDADLFWNRDGWDANLILNDSNTMELLIGPQRFQVCKIGIAKHQLQFARMS